MATNISPNECGVCNEDYNEQERCPRILSCSHTLCTECINNLFQTRNLRCPFCREKFRGESSNDVKINHSTLEFVKFFAKQDCHNPSKTLKDNAQGTKNIREIKAKLLELTQSNVGLCQESQKQTEQTLSELVQMEKEIVDENNVLENEILSKVCGIIAQNNKTLKSLKQTGSRLQKQTQDIRMKKLQLRTIKSQLERIDGSGSDREIEGLDDAQVTNSFFEKWVSDFADVNTEAKNSIKESQKELEQVKGKTKSMLRVLNSADASDVKTVGLLEDGALARPEDAFMGQLTIENFRSMTDPVKSLVREGKVYAVHTRLTEDKDRLRTYARISITEDNKLCLHALKEDPLPPGVHLINHADVMKMVHPSSQLTFLQIEDVARETILGNVYICLKSGWTRSKHFLLLCTGVLGPSYCKSKFLSLTDKGENDEAITCGDYEYNIGSGGKCLLPWDTNIEGEELTEITGMVTEAYSQNDAKVFAQFNILTGVIPNMYTYPSFGCVQEGLQILKDAISNRSHPLDESDFRHGSIQDLIIRDCGVVLAQNI